MRPSNEIQLLKVSLPILIQEVWLIPGLQVCKSHWGFAQLTLPLELQCSHVQNKESSDNNNKKDNNSQHLYSHHLPGTVLSNSHV